LNDNKGVFYGITPPLVSRFTGACKNKISRD
jgi:hypothetical protein